ncbi:MAG: LruC domain-containing protein [Nitritalea sp.]
MKQLLFFLSLILIAFSACSPLEQQEAPGLDASEGFRAMQVPDNFSYATTQTVRVQIEATSMDKQALNGVIYTLYQGNPSEDGARRVARFATDEQGRVDTEIELPRVQSDYYLQTNYIGIEPQAPVKVEQQRIQYRYDGAAVLAAARETFSTTAGGRMAAFSARMENVPAGFQSMGSWTINGRPNYLTNPDIITKELLDRVNHFLPESRDLRNTSPELLDERYSRELELTEDAEVWVTFVHTGAGYRNAVGYYYYNKNDKPRTPDDIKNRTILFPHITRSSGSGAVTGDKIKLQGPNNGVFEAGTVIGWFLLADAWSANTNSLGTGRWTLYADRNLNTFIPQASLREHMVFLYNNVNRTLLMGWEDIRRDNQGSDHDFNDVVFYASWNPITSVSPDNYPKLGDTNVTDRDGDGIPDYADEFPDDPERSFTSFGPSGSDFGTLMYEDLWPGFGDYDMNDLVVGYRIREILNARNQVKDVELDLMIRATGGVIPKGFGFFMPDMNPGNVASITGQRLATNSIQRNGNGTEAGQSGTVVIAIDDTRTLMPSMANVYLDRPVVDSDTIKLRITFNQAVNRSALGAAPYSPFIFRTNDRSHEIHLPNFRPTDLFNTALFKTAADDSDPATGKYFLSRTNLNWALHLPQEVRYPKERVDMTDVYQDFPAWVRSAGVERQNWFRENIAESLLFKR